MLFSKNQRRVLLTVVASVSLAGSGTFAIAQDDPNRSAQAVTNPGSATEKPPSKSKGREVLLKGIESADGTAFLIHGKVDADGTLEVLSTLDDVRALPIRESVMTDGMVGGGEGMTGGSGGYGGMSGIGGSMGMIPASPPDARQIAMQKINQLRSKLASPDEDRAEVEKQLRSALSEYFIADLQHRVRELDAVKARVQEMEARLQKRLDLKQEAIDLQLKRMQHEADGLEFVVPNEASASAGMGGMMGGAAGIYGESGGAAAGYPGAAAGYPGTTGGLLGGAAGSR